MRQVLPRGRKQWWVLRLKRLWDGRRCRLWYTFLVRNAPEIAFLLPWHPSWWGRYWLFCWVLPSVLRSYRTSDWVFLALLYLLRGWWLHSRRDGGSTHGFPHRLSGVWFAWGANPSDERWVVVWGRRDSPLVLSAPQLIHHADDCRGQKEMVGGWHQRFASPPLWAVVLAWCLHWQSQKAKVRKLCFVWLSRT